MWSHVLRGAALLLPLLLVGCGRGVRVQADGLPEDTDTRLGESIDINLDAWRKLPRKDLARLYDEWAVTVQGQVDLARKAPESVELLPRLSPQWTAPVFQAAKYSAALDLTVPDYARPGQADPALALHLARFGDDESARKLAGADAALLRRIAAHKAERSYPVEWTRLVALVLYSSQLKLAGGDVAGATHLVVLNQQLTKVLDAKARAGALGAALLPTGRRALQEAARAWRDPKRNKTALAADIEKALADRGPLADPGADLPLGQARADVAGAIGQVEGRAVAVTAPAALARALDLLALPVPREGVRSVAVFFDDKDRLSEVLVGYRPKIDTVYPEVGNLAVHLDERGFTAGSEAKTGSLQRQPWQSGGVSVDVFRSDRSNAVGGLVRLARAKQEPAAGDRSPREVGLAHLDRGFEATRAEVAPEQPGPMLTVKAPAATGLATKALLTPAPAEAMIDRVAGRDLVDSVRLAWAAEQNGRALEGLLPALWASYGGATPEAVEAAGGAYLAWTWQRDHARAQLRLPFNDGPPLLVVEDTRGTAGLPARAAAALKRDAEERLARIAAGKPRVRLARSVGQLNDFSLAGLTLGQDRADAEAALPKGRGYRRKDYGAAVSVVILTTPPGDVTCWARQLIVRFDDRQKVHEVRVRFSESVIKGRKSVPLAERLADPKGGAAESLPPTWPGVWADLPRGTTVHLRWQDDRTTRTFQRDRNGAELTLRDRGTEDRPSAPLRHVGHGVQGAALGATREEVRAALKPPVRVEHGAELHRQPASSPYEAVFVWYDKDKVVRVLAQHRGKVAPADAAKAIQTTWGRSLDQLGYVRRQEAASGNELGAMYWFDDRVRVKTYVHKVDKDARQYTEWREWPIGK